MQNRIRTEAHGPLGEPMERAIRSCVHCGFCLAACPTYLQLGQEMDSPRGRIVLMKDVLEGTLPLEEALPHIDRCLGCLACEPACPSGVAYRDLISPFRAMANAKRRTSLAERLRRRAVASTLPYPNRFRLAARFGRLGKPFRRFLPDRWAAMIDLVPRQISAETALSPSYPAQGKRRARVALLGGCAQQVLAPDINAATIEVLNRNGVEVVVPPGQSCCGALSWHVGHLEQARAFARQNLAAFPSDVDAILTNAAGCGSGMQEYHLILKGMEEEEQALTFRRRVQDISAFLDRLDKLEEIPRARQVQRIAYHDACHLAHAQGVRNEPRRLLRRIPGISLLEIPEAFLCCGSAGTYNIDQPVIAAALGEKKARHLCSLQPDVVATGNIGCLSQLALHLQRRKAAFPVRHTIQILRDAYRGDL